MGPKIERYDRNNDITETIVCIHWSKNPRDSRFFNKISWFFESKLFCGLIKIIPIIKPSSKPSRILPVNKDTHKTVKRLVMNTE